MLPPSESYNNLVSFESLYGICALLPSANVEITLPSADNDKFILAPSLSLSPLA